MNDRWRDEEERRRQEWRNRQDAERRRSGYGESSYSQDRYGDAWSPSQEDIQRGYGQGQSREQDYGSRRYEAERGEYGRQGQGHGPGGYGQGAPYDRRPREHYAEGGFEDHRYAHRPDYRRGRGYQEPDDYRGYARNAYQQEDRSWWDRTRDEVGSWLGDEEAERRRRADHMRHGHPYDTRPDPRRDDTGWNDRFTTDDDDRRHDRDTLGRGDFRGPDRRW